MTAIAPPAATAPAAAVSRVSIAGKLQTVLYAAVLGQWAVGFWSALYVLVLEAHYFGKTLKHYWDHLNVLWHFQAVPVIGHWLSDEYHPGRHIFLRDSPEATLGYAIVAMVVAPLIPGLIAARRDKPPLLDRVLIALHMPSAYQDRPTSTLQYVFLVPAMIGASVPGWALSAAPVFAFIAGMHRWDPSFHAGWLNVNAAWVYIVIGLAGGKFAGHKPAVKAGQDVQGFFLEGRLAVRYAALSVLSRYGQGVLEGFGKEGTLTRDEALESLTKMRAAEPSRLYPVSYRLRWDELKRAHPAVSSPHLSRKILTRLAVAFLIVAGGWGTYLRHYGIAHGFWMPW